MSNSLRILSKSLKGLTNEGGLFNFNIPSLSIKGVTLVEGSSVSSLSELSEGITKAVGDLNQLVHSAYCIGQAITNPQMLLNVIDQVAGNLMATAIDMAERVLSVLEGQIEGLFSKVAGTILNVVTSVLGFLQSILGLYEAFKNIYDNLKKLSIQSLKDFMSKEDCEFMLAMMAQCFLNKLLGNKLEKIESKITNKIRETGQSLNQTLTDELTDVNDMANFVHHESFMANKSIAQLNLMFT